MSGQDEWENIEESSSAEESSFTSQSLCASNSLPEEINEEISNETDVTKNSSTEILQKWGLVQYMKSDEISRVKHVYTTNSIWMLGVEYRFTENTGSVSLPKSEHSRGGRASSLFNLVFGSEEDNDTRSHDRYYSDDYIRSQKSHLPSQNVTETQKGKLIPPSNGSNNVIQRLRTLSFSRKSSPPDQQVPPVSQSTSNVSTGLLSPYSRLGGKRVRSFSFSKRPETFGTLQPEQNSAQLSDLQANNNIRAEGSLNTQHFLRSTVSASSLNHNSEFAGHTTQNNYHQEGLTPKPPKRTRRMTFTGFFSGKNKSGSSLPSSQRLSPHLEKRELDQRHSATDAIFDIGDDGMDSLMRYKEDVLPEDIVYSSEDEVQDNVSVETVTRDSMKKNDNLSKFEIIKDISINIIEDDSNDNQSQQTGANRRISDAGSIRSTGSFKLSAPTSLYNSDSLSSLTQNQKTLMNFILDFQSRIYCCYRKEFPPIEPAYQTTDTGWGCMHRTGQSLLAQGFLWVLLGRDWRVHNNQTDSDLLIYRKILRWFMDSPMPEQYYSIHSIARVGISLDKKIGEWFGPATIAHALNFDENEFNYIYFRRLSLAHKECPLVIYVPTDNTIYKSDILDSALGNYDPNNLFFDQKQWKPVLILLSVRLGTDKFNTSYSENLKKLFKLPQFLGIAGGRPGRSLYFVGVQDDELFYLDPHFVRPAINLNNITEFPVEDYHSTIVRAMDVSEMDPSMLLGFLCQSSQDFDNLCERINKEMDAQFPILTILNACPVRHPWKDAISSSELLPHDKFINERSPRIIFDEVEDDDIEDLKELASHEDDSGVIDVDGDDEIFKTQVESNNNTHVRRESILGEENYELL
ncbi:13196_t:CDS:10 [Acaulospora morrowiae]|uniref:Cysteine protease n=1 Tax=Acaulospora morrowiae TaxID=94023 RepID=A0A9N8YU30_9GLOM|nr:13196_t:CDS:10 [Acaulospora morrowiae]